MGTIKVFSTGGTIASVKDPETGRVRVAVSGDELLAELGEVDLDYDVSVESVCSLPSWDMNFQRRRDLAIEIQGFLERDEARGAVVTHGTDSLEETAYFLHRTVDSKKPVVVTGAMRNNSELGFDGHQNLYHALIVAASPGARDQGTMAVLNDEIHSARWVSKEHTTRPDTFASVNAGPLGAINNYEPVFLTNAPRRTCLDPGELSTVDEESVLLIKTVSGMSDRLMKFGLDQGVDGFVIEGTGSGNVPSSLAGTIETSLDRGIPVVVVSRCWAGAAVPVYGMESGGVTLRDMGVVHAAWLNGQKARVHLMLERAAGGDIEQVRQSFDDPGEDLRRTPGGKSN